MRDAIALTVLPLPARRLAFLAAALTGFVVLYAAARQFAGDMDMLGLSDEVVRTIAHFTVYGTLALLMAKALFNHYLLCWIITILLATGEEIHQLFVPFRFACPQDWMVNVAGISMFLVAAHLVDIHRRRRAGDGSLV